MNKEKRKNNKKTIDKKSKILYIYIIRISTLNK